MEIEKGLACDLYVNHKIFIMPTLVTLTILHIGINTCLKPVYMLRLCGV